MAANSTSRPRESARSPFYYSSTLIPYHLQASRSNPNGCSTREMSHGERARGHVIRRSLSSKKKFNEPDVSASAPVVPTTDHVCSQPIASNSRPTTMTSRVDSIISLEPQDCSTWLKRSRTPTSSAEVPAARKLQKTLPLSKSLQLAATEDPRPKKFACSDYTALPLCLQSGHAARESRRLSKQRRDWESENRPTSFKTVIFRVRSTISRTTTSPCRRHTTGTITRESSEAALLTRLTSPNASSFAPSDPLRLDEFGRISRIVRRGPEYSRLPCIGKPPEVMTEALERLYQPRQRFCSAWEHEILGVMLERAFRSGHTDFADLRPIGRILARCTGMLTFRLEKVYSSGCLVLERIYGGNAAREDDMATLIPPVNAPALLARPEVSPTSSGATSWFVVGIEGPPFDGKPGLRSRIKLGIAGEITGHFEVTGVRPGFRTCCVSPKQVRNTERRLRQSERSLGEPSPPPPLRAQSMCQTVVREVDSKSVMALQDTL